MNILVIKYDNNEELKCPNCGEIIQFDKKIIDNIIISKNDINDILIGIKGQIENIINDINNQKANNYINSQLKNINLIINNAIDLIKKNNDQINKFNFIPCQGLKEQLAELNKIKNLKDKINNEFNIKIDKIKKEKIKEIENDLKRIEKTFCMKDIQEFDKNNISKLLKDILKSNEIKTFAGEKLKKYIQENKNIIKSIEHLNILLVGTAGVGITTLKNAVLELEERSHILLPTSREIFFYESKKILFLRLADSRGFETKSSIEEIFHQIQDFIKWGLQSKDPDKYVHCIWYCWCGSRLEENEINVLKKLNDLYSLKTLPNIIVYTNAIVEDEVKQAERYIKKLNLENYFIPVLSKEKK